MPEVSEWNERERAAATKVFSAYVYNWRLQGRTAQIDREAPMCVDAMLRAVDAVRREPAEPLGTVKRDPITGDLARCTEFNGLRYWAPMILPPPIGPDEPWSIEADSWTTLYNPEAVVVVAPVRVARKVDKLDASCRGSRWVDRNGDLWRWELSMLGRWIRSVQGGPWCVVPSRDLGITGPFREVID